MNTVEERTVMPNGTIVQIRDGHHLGRFGVIGDTRKQHRRVELGYSELEYRVDSAHPRLKGYAWVDESEIEVVGLAEIQAYYEEREAGLQSRIRKLRDMVGRKVPKFNPEKHLMAMAPHLTDAYRHEDGSITYVVLDPEPYDTESPHNDDGSVATMIQTNTRCIDIDDDDAGLEEAHKRWQWVDDLGFFDYMPAHFDTPINRALSKQSRESLVSRYLAIFRPDILYYTEHWSAGDSHGWGYVTREAWERAMGEEYEGDITPEYAFDQEVKVYDQWARGEIYGSAHVAKRGEPADMVFGHLGYEDSKAIAAYHTDSPILEVLA